MNGVALIPFQTEFDRGSMPESCQASALMIDPSAGATALLGAAASRASRLQMLLEWAACSSDDRIWSAASALEPLAAEICLLLDALQRLPVDKH